MHIWPFLFSAQQSFSGSEIGKFGHCRVTVEAAASPAQSGRLSINVEGKRIWTESCDPSEVKVFGSSASGRIIVLNPPTGFDSFAFNGTLKKQVHFSAARDPRPFLVGERFVVWGEGIFNWIQIDRGELKLHNETRKSFALDLRTGHVRRLPQLTELGLPLLIMKNVLMSISPRRWDAAFTSHKTNEFWLRAINLETGRTKSTITRLGNVDGKRMFSAIIGWDSWKNINSRLDRNSNYLTISSPSWGRESVRIRLH